MKWFCIACGLTVYTSDLGDPDADGNFNCPVCHISLMQEEEFSVPSV